MRIAIIYLGCMVFMGCKPIDKLAPNQSSTFLKVYYETDQMQAKDLLVLEDGYLILGTYADSSSVLLKSDLKGNKLWANSFNNFSGNSMALLNDGYILIGSRIITDSLTRMQLFKTNLEGFKSDSTLLSLAAPNFGSAVSVLSNGEIVALGQTNLSGSSFSSDVIMGYNSDLEESWKQPRVFPTANQSRRPFPSIYESTNGELAWLNFITFSSGNRTINRIEGSVADIDRVSVNYNPKLFIDEEIVSVVSDFTQIPTGYAVAQTVLVNGENKIGVSVFNQSVYNQHVFSTEEEFSEGNFSPTAITTTPNALLVAAYSDWHGNGSTRIDADLMLIEVNYHGSLKSNGINSTFGGSGNEIPVRIRNTNDGGYAILGNLINTKDAQLLFLLKTNKNGTLD